MPRPKAAAVFFRLEGSVGRAILARLVDCAPLVLLLA